MKMARTPEGTIDFYLYVSYRRHLRSSKLLYLKYYHYHYLIYYITLRLNVKLLVVLRRYRHKNL